jgi:hypothetical protein
MILSLSFSLLFTFVPLSHSLFLSALSSISETREREGEMEITQVASTTPFEHQQQQVAKNKRKKFNPKFMLTNSSSDDEGDGSMEKDDDDDLYRKEINKDSIENASSEDESAGNNVKIAKAHELISGQNNNNDSPPPSSNSHPFLSPSKSLSFLQKFGTLQQQQQLFQQAAISAIAPQLTQQLSASMNLSETEAKFREFAFKTMQELLNIYGLSLSTNDIADALKQQPHVGKCRGIIKLNVHTDALHTIEREI